MQLKRVRKFPSVLFLQLLYTVFLALAFGESITEPSWDFNSYDTKEDVQKIIYFLTSDVEEAGVTYSGTAGVLDGLRLPLSYYCTADYWSEYAENLYVPKGDLDPTQARDQMRLASINERINVHSGCNIYDAATWQIALSLGGAYDHLTGAKGDNLFSITKNENRLLAAGYDGNSLQVILGANRGTSSGEGQFCYNGHAIDDPNHAYFFRQIPRAYENPDPLSEANTRVPWCDWKPITGENVWAFLIGPLHAALLEHRVDGEPVPFNSMAVQNALPMLSTFQKMQSERGAIYYAPTSLVESKDKKEESITPYTVSVENNISALAGLLVFKKVLTQEKESDSISKDPAKKEIIESALTIIQTMIYGGDYCCDGETKECHTKGVLSFLMNEAWDEHPSGMEHGEFFLSGEANNPTAGKPWKSIRELHPDLYELRAVDVNTWGLAVLGQPLLDKAHGFGTAYYLWENVKAWGAYKVDGELWGVGYSNLDVNSEGRIDLNDHTGILSGEWTAGAINMVRALITQYQNVASSTTASKKNKNKARAFVASLQKDHDCMLKHLQSLRTDRYSSESQFDSVRPQNYSSLIALPASNLAYLYASKRFLIPFNWYANPLPSTASTSWAVMLHYNYNPFSFKGDYSPNFSENGDCLME